MTYVNRELADKYQEFFNFMNREHNLILTKGEMDEILSEAERLVKKLTIHDVVGQSEQLVCPDCKSKARLQNGFIWCENDDCGGIYRAN
jgi:hypothetical protein